MIRRLGPPHAFWAFAFERENGHYARYATNGCSFDHTLRQKVLVEHSISQLSGRSVEFAKALFSKPPVTSRALQSQLRGYIMLDSTTVAFLSPSVSTFVQLPGVPLLSTRPSSYIDGDFSQCFADYFTNFHDDYDPSKFSPAITLHGRIEKCGVRFSSMLNASNRGSIVAAKLGTHYWISEVLFYFRATYNGKTLELAYVRSWYHIRRRATLYKCGEIVAREEVEDLTFRVFPISCIFSHALISHYPTIGNPAYFTLMEQSQI